MKNVLVTGASGFVGSHIVGHLSALGAFRVTGTVHRSRGYLAHRNHHCVPLDDVDALVGLLRRQNVVVHCAGIADQTKENVLDIQSPLFETNTRGTLRVAEAAVSCGVKRFVFISSLKVNGEITKPDCPFNAKDLPDPIGGYAQSKHLAEKALMELSAQTDLEVVIIRPPLVYGAGVKGNFEQLSKVVRSGVPLPFGSINNRRSLVGIDNLVSLVVDCIDHPGAANEILFVSDGQDLSTTELLRGIAQAMGRPSRLFPCPPRLLGAAAKCIGQTKITERLLMSLQVDISRTKHLLGWTPPHSVEDSLRRCFSNT